MTAKNMSPFMQYWQMTRRGYFGTYVGVSLFSAGLLFGKGFICMGEADLVCIADECFKQQTQCSAMEGFVRSQTCCYTKNLPCHIRFWFCVMCWASLFFTSCEKVLRHDFMSLEETIGRPRRESIHNFFYSMRHFLDKVQIVWALIILCQAYLTPDPFAYLFKLFDSSVCVFMFNVSFVAQLAFICLDMLTTMLTIGMFSFLELFAPISKHHSQAMQQADGQRTEI